MPVKAVLKAPAKVNLGLWIIGRRPDGYHEIRTIFVLLDRLYDTILVEESDTLRVEVEGMDIPVEENTVYRAVRILERASGREIRLRILIRKLIPAGAGLGGGSSDAASVMLFLNEALGLGFSRNGLMKLGAGVGSDVPFFLSGYRVAIGRGRGEEIEGVNVDIPFEMEAHFPGIHLSTARMYGEVSRRGLFVSEDYAEGRISGILRALGEENLHMLASSIENVFEKVALELEPALREFREKLRRRYPLVFMSGSGSAFVGIREP